MLKKFHQENDLNFPPKKPNSRTILSPIHSPEDKANSQCEAMRLV